MGSFWTWILKWPHTSTHRLKFQVFKSCSHCVLFCSGRKGLCRRSFVNLPSLLSARARRASPQGHGKSLPDAVKTIYFASLLEGFWPNPSNRLRPSVRALLGAKTQICDTVVRSELGGLKSAMLSITFFSHFQNCDAVDLDSGHVLPICQNCDTVDLDSHQDFCHLCNFSELRYCGAALIPYYHLL